MAEQPDPWDDDGDSFPSLDEADIDAIFREDETTQLYHHGAQWTYQDVFEATGDLVGGHQEENFNRDWPAVFEGDYGQLEVVPDQPGVIDPAEIPPIDLVRQDNPTEAYSIDRTRDPIRLVRHHPQWGMVVFAMTYFRDRRQPNRFVFPTRTEDHRYVAIKILNREVVDNLLLRGGVGVNDPYRDVDRMRNLQDGQFVLPCIDFLQTNENLYIITPKGQRTLQGAMARRNIGQLQIPNAPPSQPPPPQFPTNVAINIFSRVLKIVDYLQSMGINHHDLKPKKLLIMPNNEIVVFDFAKSLRMPYNNDGTRKLMRHRPPLDAPPWMRPVVYHWMSPEVFNGQAYDGCAMDVWAAAVMFYNMLTGFVLYGEPSLLDAQFCYFLLSGALEDDATELAREQHGRIGHRLLPQMIATHAQFTQHQRLFLATILNVNPQERLTLAGLLQAPMFEHIQPKAFVG